MTAPEVDPNKRQVDPRAEDVIQFLQGQVSRAQQEAASWYSVAQQLGEEIAELKSQ